LGPGVGTFGLVPEGEIPQGDIRWALAGEREASGLLRSRVLMRPRRRAGAVAPVARSFVHSRVTLTPFTGKPEAGEAGSESGSDQARRRLTGSRVTVLAKKHSADGWPGSTHTPIRRGVDTDKTSKLRIKTTESLGGLGT
jgi:hypothetical protein